ncbi:MAG: hypothetical protein EBS56_08145 [Planctomycetia bacterium]|nr:hypothetical protein [Planctomycetia bacterium]
MPRHILRSLILVGAVCVLPPEARAGAEPAALTVAYGNGVHAFYDGDFQCSYDELSRVIEAGSNDPRVHYFRGLAALKLGRMDEAEADFQQGANLEADGRGAVSSQAVSRALERVQGCDRLKLEEYRSRARVASLQRVREGNRQRYSGIEDGEADVLRRRRPERIEAAEPVARPLPRARATDEEASPAVERPVPQAERPEPEQPAEPAADTANPFADDPAVK